MSPLNAALVDQSPTAALKQAAQSLRPWVVIQGGSGVVSSVVLKAGWVLMRLSRALFRAFWVCSATCPEESPAIAGSTARETDAQIG